MSTQSFFCAFCRAPRRINLKRHVSARDFIAAALVAGLLGYFIWQDLDARILVIQGVVIIFWEIALQFRWRLSLGCQTCGFDPMTYIKSPENAATHVKAFMDVKRKDPFYALRAYPMLIPRRRTGNKMVPYGKDNPETTR